MKCVPLRNSGLFPMASNLAAFRDRNPALVERLQASRAQSPVELALVEGASPGAFYLHDQRKCWIHQVGAAQSESVNFRKDLIAGQAVFFCDLYILIRFGLGLHWLTLVKTLRPPISAYGIIVVEPEPSWLLAASCLFDLSVPIHQTNTFWVAGADWQEQFTALIEREFLHGCGQAAFLPGHPLYGPIQKEQFEIVRQTVEKILSIKRVSFFQVVQDYANSRKHRPPQSVGRLWALADRRSTNRVLYQVTEPLLQGFERIGVDIRRGHRDESRYFPPLLSLHEFIDNEADSFFSVNVPFGEIMSHPLAAQIPAIKMLWYVDHPYYWSEFPRQKWDDPSRDIFVQRITDHHLFLYDPGDRFFLLEKGIVPAGYLPHYSAFHDVPVEECPEYRCDVSFIGSLFKLDSPFLDFPPEQATACLDYIACMGEIVYREGLIPPYFDGLFERNPPPPVLEEFIRRGWAVNRTTISKLIYLDADNRYRLDCVKALAGLDFKLFGDEFWQNELSGHPASRSWQGRVPFDRLPSAYKSSRINVNLASRQLKTAHNNRTFNIIGLGRLVLSNYFEGMEHVFEQGNGIDYFSTPEQLREKVEYYLAHPEEREICAARGRESILKEHKPEDRARFVLETVQVRLSAHEPCYRAWRNWNPQDYRRIQPPLR